MAERKFFITLCYEALIFLSMAQDLLMKQVKGDQGSEQTKSVRVRGKINRKQAAFSLPLEIVANGNGSPQ